MIRRHRHIPTTRELTALADGSLPAGRRIAVEQAVADSPRLQRTVAAQRRALDAMDAAHLTAPPALRARLALALNLRARRRPTNRATRAITVTAVAAATIAVVALMALSGGPETPTVADAAVLASRPALTPAPPHHSDRVTLSALRAAALPFPYWEDHYGFAATGVRRDKLATRLATTVFYKHGEDQIAYTIISGPPLITGSIGQSATRAGTRLVSFTIHGRTVVTWLRRGHTCVLSATHTRLNTLLALASWRGGGEIPY